MTLGTGGNEEFPVFLITGWGKDDVARINQKEKG